MEQQESFTALFTNFPINPTSHLSTDIAVKNTIKKAVSPDRILYQIGETDRIAAFLQQIVLTSPT